MRGPAAITLWYSARACGNATLRQIAPLLAATSGSTRSSTPFVGVMPPNFSPDEYGELWVPSPWGVPSHPLAPDKDPHQFRDRNYLDVWRG
jgi:hypothetical protein